MGKPTPSMQTPMAISPQSQMKQERSLQALNTTHGGNHLKELGTFASQVPFRYAGYRYNNESKYYYLQQRYYNPDIGRFLTLDPMLGEKEYPITNNGYNYANNNPVMYYDPSGNAAVLAVYFVPGIGQVALMATGSVVLGGIAYKAGTWIGKKAKDYYIKAQNNKQTKKRIEGIQKQVRKHKDKISKNPRSRDRKHWEKEIRAWEKEIARLKKRLK